MSGILEIDVLAGAALILLWYLIFLRYNRQRSIQVLQCIKAVFGGHAEILGVRWIGASRFHVHVRVLSTLFQHASIAVHLHPRELPLNWAWGRLKRRQETLTFEADLEFAPVFNLEVHNHRWCWRTRRFPKDTRRPAFEHCGPFVLTTRHDWAREITTMINALVASRDCDFLTVSFRRTSPHFSATLPLDSLRPDSGCEAQMFEVLRELASCASASRF